MLADYGADVIKIERPGVGDDLRNWREDGIEIFWKAYSRNKRSVCWNLKSDEDKAKLLQLVRTAHVFIENSGGAQFPLSTRRALAVVEHLVVFYGLPRDKLAPVGYGATKPVNTAVPYSPENTRIEIINLSGI